MCNNPTNPAKPVNITLTVRAEELYNLELQPLSNNQGELDTFCSLSDDNLGEVPSGGTLNDYTTPVYASKTVTWDGKSSQSNGYRVLINSITTTNPNFFANETGNSGKVTVTLNDGIDGVIDTYTINFTIDPPGNGPALSYSLDPKLRGRSSTTSQ